MLDFTRKLTPLSAASYALWRAMGRRQPVLLDTRTGARFELRPNSCGNNDYGVAYEVFVHEYYHDMGRLNADKVDLIVDLGANVGYSMLYYLHRFPRCRLISFEPHPRHFCQAVHNLEIDGTRERVEFHARAAGARSRQMRLTDCASSSSLTDLASSSTFDVDVVDIFPLLQGRRIDLLKMDIEGGEYEILEDARFGDLHIDTIVMEWHSRGGGHADRIWCYERLKALGFVTEDVFVNPSHGLFWATRSGGSQFGVRARK